jgi:hypothetical protein
MQTTLLTTGLVCIIAAIIGGGLKGFGIEVPLLQSLPRQFALGILGCVLVLIALRGQLGGSSTAPAAAAPAPAPAAAQGNPASGTPVTRPVPKPSGEQGVTVHYQVPDTGPNAMNIVVDRTTEADGYAYDVSFAVPKPPANGKKYAFSSVIVYGDKITNGKRTDIPPGVLPTKTGNWKSGDRVSVAFNLPKQYADPAQGWYLFLRVGSGSDYLISPDLFTGQPAS